jgi:type I restriction enzyme S subunit
MSFSEWKEVKLEDIGEIVGGGTPSTKKESYYGGDISWITPKDLANHSERYICKGERMITEEGLANSSAKLMSPNTVLFSSRAPIGYVAIAGKELCTNQGFKSITPREGISSSMFLYYLLKHKKQDIESVASGTTFMEVSGSTMKKLPVIIPPIEEQQVIANTLSCLDDKIELNNRMNKTLEEIAQTIFKNWFVDFEPFQDSEFEDSELGMIPKGWRVGTIGEVASVTSGKRPPFKQEYSSVEICVPVVGASSVMAYTNKHLFNEKILITGRVGTHGIIQRFNTKCWPSDNTLVIKSEYYEFMYQTLNGIDYKSMNRGSTQPLITQTDLKNIRIIIPTESVLNNFENLLIEIMGFWYENKNQNNTLIQIRDSLLPKLMSGEIRVPIEEVQ